MVLHNDEQLLERNRRVLIGEDTVRRPSRDLRRPLRLVGDMRRKWSLELGLH